MEFLSNYDDTLKEFSQPSGETRFRHACTLEDDAPYVTLPANRHIYILMQQKYPPPHTRGLREERGGGVRESVGERSVSVANIAAGYKGRSPNIPEYS